MCTYVCIINMYVCIYTHLQINMYAYINVQICTYIYIYISLYIYIERERERDSDHFGGRSEVGVTLHGPKAKTQA